MSIKWPQRGCTRVTRAQDDVLQHPPHPDSAAPIVAGGIRRVAGVHTIRTQATVLLATPGFLFAIFYRDIAIQSGMMLEGDIAQARQLEETRRSSGFDPDALGAAARKKFVNWAFQELAAVVPSVIEKSTGRINSPSQGKASVRPYRPVCAVTSKRRPPSED